MGPGDGSVTLATKLEIIMRNENMSIRELVAQGSVSGPYV